VKTKECLLIEDDLDDQEIFQMALAATTVPAKCTIAGSGAEALTKVRTDHDYIPDVIFIDMNMPMMNGVACKHELRKLPQLQKTRIYMYSTSVNVYAVGNGETAPDDFIVKPASLTDFIRILSVIFEGLVS